MIDLIIPYYNNSEGLQRTLDSIDSNIFYITIVDDNSDQSPWRPKANQVLRYNQNRGPGYARQFGMDRTYNKYIMFLDTGDVFTSIEAQQGILHTITTNPQIDFWSFSYFHYDQRTTETDNRLHGKVYKREFLNKYHITFPLTSSYLNEDIGFNMICRRCTEMKFIELPVIEQIKDPNSLSQKNNQEALYKNQTRALSLVSFHTINTLRENNIDVAADINQIAIALYYWFIRTAAERPQCLQDAWSGAKLFYDKYKKEIHPENLLLGNSYLKKCLLYKNKINFKINILQFVRDIWHNENLPNNYLTFS